MMKKKYLMIAVFLLSALQMNAQENRITRIPLIGEQAPSFTAQSTNGKIVFPKDFGASWKILFSHPKDFTPVCSSELLELAQQQESYKNLGVQIIVLSTDILSQHNDWKSALEEINYKDKNPVKIIFPLVDDSKYLISSKYGLIHSANLSENVRAVFIIDPSNKIRSISFYPNELGRNMDEIKRSVIALQTIDRNNNIATPANWVPGEKVMVPFLTESEEKKLGDPQSNVHRLSWFMNFRSLD